MKRYLKTIDRETALSLVMGSVPPIEDEILLPVYDAPGRVTTRAVFGRFSNPSYLCAAMDGYAVDFENTAEADLASPLSLEKGAGAWKINTGDILPDRANAVVMIEEVEEGDGTIRLRRPVHLWQNVRMVGEDLIEGDMLVPRNYRVAVKDIGLFLAGGVTHVHVRRKPRLIIVPTGRELVDLYAGEVESLKPGTLVEFNSYTLWKLAEEAGYEVVRCDAVSAREDLRELILRAVREYDVVAVNAGSSAGTEDFTEDVIRESGSLLFHGVSMMPGKPLVFGLVDGTPVFGVPGYPVSAVVVHETFLAPLCRHLTGLASHEREVPVVTPYKVPSRIGIEEIIRVNLTEKNGTLYAFALPRGASVFSSVARADGFIRVPERIEGFNEGEITPCVITRPVEEIERRIHIVGSHDLCLDLLRDLIKARRPDLDLLSSSTGSLSGILAFRRGITDLCTTHILDEKENIYNLPAITRYVQDRSWRLIHVAKRLQGLVVQKGNPKGIGAINDLARWDVKFVNRQSGSGTRILLDKLLSDGRLDKDSVNGYDREESSHTSVALLVKESVADTGLAVYGAAKLFSLDFIPLAEEDYDLLVAEDYTRDPRFELLMELLRSGEFKDGLEELGGYNTRDTGVVKAQV